MIKEYTISNFKAFSTPATLPIKPITLIYGANSAGKSSIFQSLLMLKQTHEKSGGDDNAFILDGAYTELSSFSNIIYNNDSKNEMVMRFVFDTDELDNFHLSLKMPKKTKTIKEIIQKDYENFCVENKFVYDKIKNFFLLTEASLFIGNSHAPIIKYIIDDYCIGEIDVNREHSFWETYWNLFGKSCAIDIIESIYKMYFLNKKVLSNVSVDSNDDLNTNFQEQHIFKWRQKIDNDENSEYYSIIKLKELIDKNEEIDELQLFEILKKYFLMPEGRISTIATQWYPFKYGDFTITNYSSDDGLPDEVEEISVDDIFKGIQFNRDKYYYSDNLSVFFAISCFLVNKFVAGVKYIGPFRRIQNHFFASINDVDVNDEKTGGSTNINKYLFRNDRVLHMVNKNLQKMNIDYNISFNQVSWDADKEIGKYSIVVSKNFSGLQTLMKDVGFGISQVIPVVVQCSISNSEPILIEQPELHLHPALQAELGDLFIDSSMKNKNTLLIETHSEHILLRIMRRIRETTNGTLPEGVTPIRAEDVSVVYVESVETDGDRHSIIREMPLNDQGELVKAWPGGFFEEGLREVF